MPVIVLSMVPPWQFPYWQWLSLLLTVPVVVSITLLAICSWATFVGSMLPLLARRVGVDPAVVSAPLVTTLVDATGLIIYLVVARIVLGL